MNFLKTTMLSGLFILLPLVLLWIGLKELVEVLEAVAIAIADVIPFPPGIDENLPAASILVLLLIAIAALAVGIGAGIPWINRAGRNVERSVLMRIPGYRLLKLLSSSLVGLESGGIQAALLKDGSGGGDPCYLVEKHADGRATIMLPWTPASFSGSLKIVQLANLEILSCTLDEYSRSLTHMGVGLEACLGQGTYNEGA